MKNNLSLGVNIDHIATLRQARLSPYPDLLTAVKTIENAGANSITLHLREDRRHIQDSDVYALKKIITTKMNLEMAATAEMVGIACTLQPEDCCLVPENRQELTTEGGLNVLSNQAYLSDICAELAHNNVRVSLFIDADFAQIDAAKATCTPVIELHTGDYANASTEAEKTIRLNKLIAASQYAHHLGLQVNAGHGLHLQNTADIAKISEIVELNIGHAIIARAIFVGLVQAIREMKALMDSARV